VLEKMAASGNENFNLSFFKSSRDFDRTSDSSSVFQCSPEPQQLGSPQTDQIYQKSCFSSDESYIRLWW